MAAAACREGDCSTTSSEALSVCCLSLQDQLQLLSPLAVPCTAPGFSQELFLLPVVRETIQRGLVSYHSGLMTELQQWLPADDAVARLVLEYIYGAGLSPGSAA